MASGIYTSFLRDLALGNINVDTDNLRVMLVGAAYTEDFDAHSKRNQVTNEVSGTGYTTKGAVCDGVVSVVDTVNNRVALTFNAVSWPASTITARKAVIYKDRAGASSADELIACIDFGTDQVSSNGTFTLSASTINLNNQNG